MTPLWIGLGVDELSVGSAQLLRTRKAISTLDSTECGQWVQQLHQLGTSEEIRVKCRTLATEKYPDLLL